MMPVFFMLTIGAGDTDFTPYGIQQRVGQLQHITTAFDYPE